MNASNQLKIVGSLKNMCTFVCHYQLLLYLPPHLSFTGGLSEPQAEASGRDITLATRPKERDYSVLLSLMKGKA